MKFLLDTHTVIWAAGGDARLGKAAQAALSDCSPKDLALSSISLLEIALLVKKRKIEMEMPLREYLDHLQRAYCPLPLTGGIAADSVHLDMKQGDPFDRIIVATALEHRLPLVTRDQKITDSGLLPVIW